MRAIKIERYEYNGWTYERRVFEYNQHQYFKMKNGSILPQNSNMDEFYEAAEHGKLVFSQEKKKVKKSRYKRLYR